MTGRPMVIELVGPAGSGKSTVWDVLGRRPGVVGASVWELPRPLLYTSAGRTLPDVARVLWAARGVPWEEIQQLIRLDALELFLRGEPGSSSAVVALDEGPVFAFSWFRLLGHPCFRNGRLNGWWQAALLRWAQLVDVIVLFDAADPLLAHRVRTRAKPHPFRDRTEQDITTLNSAYRREFDWVIAELAKRARHGGPRVVSISTDGAQPDELADRVLAACRETVDAR
jgi:hypothetical protein